MPLFKVTPSEGTPCCQHLTSGTPPPPSASSTLGSPILLSVSPGSLLLLVGFSPWAWGGLLPLWDNANLPESSHLTLHPMIWFLKQSG